MGITLHELLARVLLEEGLMLDGPDQVVQHKAKDRKDLLLSVVREMDEVRILVIRKFGSREE